MGSTDNLMDKNDHDTLIRMEANFSTFLRQYHLDMKEIKDGTTLKLAEHETRLRTIERVHEDVKPEEAIKTLRNLENRLDTFEIGYQKTLAFISGISIIIGFMIAKWQDVYKFFIK